MLELKFIWPAIGQVTCQLLFWACVVFSKDQAVAIYFFSELLLFLILTFSTMKTREMQSQAIQIFSEEHAPGPSQSFAPRLTRTPPPKKNRGYAPEK